MPIYYDVFGNIINQNNNPTLKKQKKEPVKEESDNNDIFTVNDPDDLSKKVDRKDLYIEKLKKQINKLKKENKRLKSELSKK